MTITLLLFVYGVGITIVLTLSVARSEYYRQLYLEVTWDQYSLENVKYFFRKIKPVLNRLYPIVDKLNKKQGRPATDRRFQLRFIIWWKIFGPQGQQTAVNQLNNSPSLQKILEAPVKDYTRSSLRRFLSDLGESGLRQMGVSLVKFLHRKKLITLSTLVLDFFLYTHI